MSKYKIQMRLDGKTPEGKLYPVYYEEVEGEPFVIPGYEEFQFFIREVGSEFVVSEVTTGMQIGDYYIGAMSAEGDIKRRIDKKGVEFLRKYIAENKIPENKQ